MKIPDEKSDKYNRLTYAESLECDICGKFLCMSYQFDLQGSYFYCEECMGKIVKNEAEERVRHKRESECLGTK